MIKYIYYMVRLLNTEGNRARVYAALPSGLFILLVKQTHITYKCSHCSVEPDDVRLGV